MTTFADNLIRTLVAAAIVLAGLAADAAGANIRDIARLQGARTNQLMAVSLVVGLDGTGDGGSLETIRSLGNMLQKFNHSGISLAGINADNVALVHVTATIGESGAREGTALDVKVSAINGAKSLAGGRLIQCQMLGPMATPVVYALASGDIVMDNPTSPTTGLIKGGAVMETNVVANVVANGRITIVLDGNHSTWSIASSIARVINDAEAQPGATIATAASAAEIIVKVPTVELADPADFIARVLDLPVLMPDLKARIVINRRTRTIVITDDVEIDPVMFTHNGLTINTMPATAANGPTTVQQLVDAFNQLQVLTEDQIAILMAIQRSGHLHAEVVEQ